MTEEFVAEREVERLQSMHEAVERLRSQLKTIQLHSPAADDDASGSGSPGLLPAQKESLDNHT